MDRLQRFRAAIKNIGSTTAEGGVRDELIVAHEDFMRGSEIAGRLELDPSARVLVVGGIGTGKSTQVAAAARRLEQSMLVVSVIDDLLRGIDLRGTERDVLLVQSALLDHLFAQISTSQRSQSVVDPSLLNQLNMSLRRDDEFPLIEDLSMRCEVLRKLCARQAVCVVVDGQDRIPATDFVLVTDAVDAVIGHASCGAIVVGPPDLPFAEVDEFSSFEGQLVFIDPLPVDRLLAAEEVLVDIMQRRVSNLVPVEGGALWMLTTLSSGVVRDALHLLKLALNHAFSVGRDSVTTRSVEIAHEEYVRSKLFGLSASAGAKLRERLNNNAWTLFDDDERDLYRRGLLVAQYDEENRLSFVVHAAIAPMLPKVAA